MSSSNNHATLLAHLYALRDMMYNPQAIINGDYELVQVLANNDEKTQFNFYLREPRTQFFISADPHVFAVGNIDKLCDTNPIKVFQTLAKICSLRLLATEKVHGWPFNDGLTTRAFCKMSDVAQMLHEDYQRSTMAPEDDTMRLAFEANPYHAIYLNDHSWDDDLVKLLRGNKEAQSSIRHALRMVKHSGVRKELMDSFSVVVG